MAWTFLNWVLCNVLIGLGIVLITYLMVGIVLWRSKKTFYSMVTKLFNIKRCLLDVDHQIVQKNNDIHNPSFEKTKFGKCLSKIYHCCGDISAENSELADTKLGQPIGNTITTIREVGKKEVLNKEKEFEQMSTASNKEDDEGADVTEQNQDSQDESEQEETPVQNLVKDGKNLLCWWPHKPNEDNLTATTDEPQSSRLQTTKKSEKDLKNQPRYSSPQRPTASSKVSIDHPTHREHIREVLNVYGRCLTLSKKKNVFLILTITAIVISAVIIAGFQGCFLANITVYQDGPCPFYGLMECYYGPNSTYFQCTPNSTIDFSLSGSSATCFRWIGRDTSVADVMTQIGACVGLLTAFGSLVEFLMRLLLYVFQQRLGVSAGMRRVMEKTIGINKITQPTHVFNCKLPCHFGILDLRLYQHPWLVFIFIVLYLCLPVIAIASIILLSYFQISITSLTYIVLITFVLVCSLGLLWVLWEENEIGKIIPGAWEDASDVMSPLKKSLPLLQQIIPKEDLDKISTFADHAVKELQSHIDGIKKGLLTRANKEFSGLNNSMGQALPSSAIKRTTRAPQQLTGSAQEIRERKAAEQLQDFGSKVFRKS
jgi:FtsZ-interacting cell division protein ZipA